MDNFVGTVCSLLWSGQVDDAKALINTTNVNEVDLCRSRRPNILIATISYANCTPEFIDYLLDMGLDINATDLDNETALFTAVRLDVTNIIPHLLKRGIRVGIISTRVGGSEIDEAIRMCRIEIVWLLYSYGARPVYANIEQMNDLIGPYIRCSSVAYTLIGIRKFRRSPLSQHPKEIILMIAKCVIKTKTKPVWTL
jgi:hypothetical protein